MSGDPISALLQDVARQDRAAFRALYVAAGAKLMGTALRILQDRHEAEDAVQEVMTRVWLKAGAFDPARGAGPDPGMGWLVALMRNHAIDRIRARAPLSDDEAAIALAPDPAPRAEAQVIASAQARRIGDCLDRLEPDRAQAVRGAYLDGLSYADLAQRHGVPLNTMRTWLRRSLLRLRECMET